MGADGGHERGNLLGWCEPQLRFAEAGPGDRIATNRWLPCGRMAGVLCGLRVLLLSIVIALAAGTAPAMAATCSDFATQAAAQAAANTIDADGDGIYCESLPCPCSTGKPPAPAPTPVPVVAAPAPVPPTPTPTPSSAPNQVGEGWDRPFPDSLSSETALAAWNAELLRRYGAAFERAAERWVVCPKQAYVPGFVDPKDGLYYAPIIACEAVFATGAERVATNTVIAARPGVIDAFDADPVSFAWTRKWRAQNDRSCTRKLAAGAALWTNDDTCPSKIVREIEDDLRTKGRPSRRYVTPGILTAGFEDLYVWRCGKPRSRVIRCENTLGDAFRYRPGRRYAARMR